MQKVLKKMLLMLLIFLNCFSSFAQGEFILRDGRKRDQFKFDLVRNLVVIPIFINDKGPYNFILDTGVSLMLITNPELKDSLNIPYIRKISISGLGEGEDIDAWVSNTVNVRVNNAVANNLPMAILAIDNLNLSGFAGKKIDGLIGFEYFNSFVVRFSNADSVITVFNQRDIRIGKRGSKIPITIERNKPYTDVQIGNEKGQKKTVKLLIDTGAGHPLSLENDGEESYELPDKFMQANLGVGLSGNISGFIGRIPDLKLGKYDLKNVIAAYPDYKDVAAKVKSINRNGTIGNAVLKKFDVTFDYRNQAMYLRPGVTYREPFEHDMSGLELVAGGVNYDQLIINRVEPGSAADKIGLQKDDQILSINLKAVKDLTMERVLEIFRSRNERSIFIEVLRDKETLRHILTLQRRI